MSIVTALAPPPGEALAARRPGDDAQADSEEHIAGASGHLPSLSLWLSPWPQRQLAERLAEAWCTDQMGKNACAGLTLPTLERKKKQWTELRDKKHAADHRR